MMSAVGDVSPTKASVFSPNGVPTKKSILCLMPGDFLR